MTESAASPQPLPATPPIYRPFTIARAGELAAYKDLTAASHAQITPVFIVAARDWDYDNEVFAKSPTAHLADLPKKLHAARGDRLAYIDLSLLDDEGLVHGQHPLHWLVTEAQKLGLLLMPLATPQSSAAFLAAAKSLHAANGRGIGIRLTTNDWPGINAAAATTVMSAVGAGHSDVDLFLDFEAKVDALVVAAIQNEMHAASSTGWRHITTGGHSWPKDLPTGQGTFVLRRAELAQYTASYLGLKGISALLPDFFDHLVANPEVTLDIDPKLLTISATLRYAAEAQWVFVRGGLYKASGGKGKGGASVAPALQALIGHTLYGTPVRTKAETWIEAAAAGGPSGNPMTWRRWATYRHIEVTLHSLANSL
ncbi:beta family protein [Arthrobacter sp. AK01]|uniref:beta family protein n=1 Tax=Arthrobacter sp. AK01 TaxID=2894084 RepID=UPI001E5C7808|nr:beta family protein [Arthrobacter sp. AK01]MCD4849671.1 beta family protein [Arthrobacter sp. AK01]